MQARAKVLAAAAVEAAAKKAAQAADAASAAKGLNDNAHGIDRFGYRVCPKSTLCPKPQSSPHSHVLLLTAILLPISLHLLTSTLIPRMSAAPSASTGRDA